MKLKLTSDDRSGIDLLLDEATAAAIAPAPASLSQGYVAVGGVDHLNAVRRVLQLLQVLPASEPPADLASRTMMRISMASGQTIAGHLSEPAAKTGVGDQQIRPA